jgi:CBS-domain-containing membrane protein
LTGFHAQLRERYGLAALLFKQPLLFPNLGPSVLLFFEQPLDPPSSPRNTIIGHAVALVVGIALLVVLGLWGKPSVLIEGVTGARIAAAALSVSITGSILILLRSNHPPAAATGASRRMSDRSALCKHCQRLI